MWTLLVGPCLANQALSPGSIWESPGDIHIYVTNLFLSDSDSDDPDDPPPVKPPKSSKREGSKLCFLSWKSKKTKIENI